MLMIYRELSDAAGLVMAESVINSSYKELPAGMEERYEMTVKPVLHHCLEDWLLWFSSNVLLMCYKSE